MTNQNHSSLNLFEISEIIRILYSLQKSVYVTQMRQLSVFTLHPTRQHIRNCTLLIKFETKFSVHSAKNWASIATISTPNVSKVLEFLQFESSHPFEKSLWHSQFLMRVVYGISMIKDILVLCITKISKHVFSVAWKLLQVEQLIQAQLFNKPRFILFPHLNFNFMSKNLISVSLFLIDG